MPTLERQELSDVFRAAATKWSTLKVPAAPRLFLYLIDRVAEVTASAGLTSLIRTRDELYWTVRSLQIGQPGGRHITARPSIDPLVSKWRKQFGAGLVVPVHVRGVTYAVTTRVEVTRADLTFSMSASVGTEPVRLGNPGQGREPEDDRARAPESATLRRSIAAKVDAKLKPVPVHELVDFEWLAGQVDAESIHDMFAYLLRTVRRWRLGGLRTIAAGSAALLLLSVTFAVGARSARLLRREGAFFVIAQVTWRGDRPCLYLDWRRSPVSGHFVVYRNGVAVHDVGIAKEYEDCEGDLRVAARYNVVKMFLGLETSVSSDITYPPVTPETELRHRGEGHAPTAAEASARNDANGVFPVVVGVPATFTLRAEDRPGPGAPADVVRPEASTAVACTASVDFGAGGRAEGVPCGGSFTHTFLAPGTYPMTVTFVRAGYPPQVVRYGGVVVRPHSDGGVVAGGTPNAASK